MASLHFCSECNNLLYPKADQQRRIMVYACRICAYDELVENKCVYRNDLLTVTKEQVGVTTDLGSDPTLASTLEHSLSPVRTRGCGVVPRPVETEGDADDSILCLRKVQSQLHGPVVGFR
ncbi:DNA-directed RNA polymerase subunit [Mycena venus]|uniref:DNA-directed RNA polymerase subunit n=1 Tax=Mycena venus TaxID=2733690 RepID=A0A8H6Z4B3_9AGAR|nr:DNA-directed RNA polymerase subunit [Mycena venus]